MRRNVVIEYGYVVLRLERGVMITMWMITGHDPYKLVINTTLSFHLTSYLGVF